MYCIHLYNLEDQSNWGICNEILIKEKIDVNYAQKVGIVTLYFLVLLNVFFYQLSDETIVEAMVITYFQ